MAAHPAYGNFSTGFRCAADRHPDEPSTVASACLDNGIEPVVLDNLATGRREFTEGRIFTEHPDLYAVIDCAALIVVPDLLGYYRENVAKGIEFLGHLVRNGCTRLLFSSSATTPAGRSRSPASTRVGSPSTPDTEAAPEHAPPA